MNSKIIKTLSTFGLVLGCVASLLSSWADKQQQEIEIKECVEKAVKDEIQKQLPNEEISEKKEEESQ